MNLNQYKIIKELGSGVGTVIYLCEAGNKETVIKELTDPHYFDYLNDEIHVLSKIPRHPHIIHVENAFVFGKKIFIEYEYCQGGDLYDVIQDHGPFDEAQARVLLSQMCSALLHAKQSGFYHCDIKPENVLLKNDNEFVIADWDLAKANTTNSINLSDGSTLSMPPEMILGELNPHSDVYSLGCLLYFCLFGERVFQLKTSVPQFERVLTHLEAPLTLPENHLSEAFQCLLKAMLYKNPKRRVSLEEVDAFLNQGALVLKEDSADVYAVLSDLISEKRIAESKKASFNKFERHQKEYKKNKDEASKEWMLAHLVALSYLKDPDAQAMLLAYRKEPGLAQSRLLKHILSASTFADA